MSILLSLGLIGFVGVHLTRVVAGNWRDRQVSYGKAGWYKLIYSLVSLVSFSFICLGYGEARLGSPVIWVTAPWIFNFAAGLMLLSFICLVASYVRRSAVKIWLRHPMLWGIVWYCIAHLLTNGREVDLVLFISLLVWAVVVLVSCYRRDAKGVLAVVTPSMAMTLLNLFVAVVVYALVVWWLHPLLIGVSALPYL